MWVSIALRIVPCERLHAGDNAYGFRYARNGKTHEDWGA